MSDKPDGGPAFAPHGAPHPTDPTKAIYGMTLRDYFAARCPAWWMDDVMPKAVGDVRDAIVRRGILAKPRSDDVLRSYSDADRRKLQIAIQYEYADAMLAERDK